MRRTGISILNTGISIPLSKRVLMPACWFATNSGAHVYCWCIWSLSLMSNNFVAIDIAVCFHFEYYGVLSLHGVGVWKKRRNHAVWYNIIRPLAQGCLSMGLYHHSIPSVQPFFSIWYCITKLNSMGSSTNAACVSPPYPPPKPVFNDKHSIPMNNCLAAKQSFIWQSFIFHLDILFYNICVFHACIVPSLGDGLLVTPLDVFTYPFQFHSSWFQSLSCTNLTCYKQNTHNHIHSAMFKCSSHQQDIVQDTAIPIDVIPEQLLQDCKISSPSTCGLYSHVYVVFTWVWGAEPTKFHVRAAGTHTWCVIICWTCFLQLKAS